MKCDTYHPIVINTYHNIVIYTYHHIVINTYHHRLKENPPPPPLVHHPPAKEIRRNLKKKLALLKVKVKMPSWLFCWICVERNLDGGADEEPKVGADIQVGGVVAQPVVDLKIAKVELN